MTRKLSEQLADQPAAPPEAKITGIVATRGNTRALELQVRIAGQDRKFLLALDALEDHGLTGPAAAEELREIRQTLGGIEEKIVDLTNAIPNHDDLNGYIDRLAGAVQR